MTDLNKERELCNQSFEKYWDDFCEAYGNGFDRSLAKLFFANGWGEAKAQAVPEGYVVVPKDVAERTIGHISIAICHPNNTRDEENIMSEDQVVIERAIDASESGAEK